jgi:hypothetical protein
MAEWKNIVVETSANTIKQNTEGYCTGFSNHLGLEQGGMGNIGNNGIYNDSDNPGENRHEFVTVEEGTNQAIDTLGSIFNATQNNYTHYTALPIDNNEVYMLAYNDNSNGNILNSKHGKDYYWHRYGGDSGQLSVRSLTAGMLTGSSFGTIDGSTHMNVDYPSNSNLITFTGSNWEADSLYVNSKLVVGSFTTDNNTFTESATDTNHTIAGQATSNDSTITFNSALNTVEDALTSLQTITINDTSVGFRVLNTGTTTHDFNLRSGNQFNGLTSSPTDGASNHNTSLVFFTNQKIETTGSEGWDLKFQRTNPENFNVDFYTLDHDTHVGLNQTDAGSESPLAYKVTLNADASVNATAWSYLVNFAQGNDNNVSNVILKNKAVKQNIQFGLSCDEFITQDGNGAFGYTYDFIYPSVHKLKGNLQLDISNDTTVEDHYGIESGAIITNVADQANRPIGAIHIGGTATNPVPMLRVA